MSTSSFRDRFFSPKVARAMMSPLGIVLAGAGAAAGIVVGLPVVAGRGFTAEDRVGTPLVTVINEALAARLKERFAVANPVGQSVNLPALGFGRAGPGLCGGGPL